MARYDLETPDIQSPYKRDRGLDLLQSISQLVEVQNQKQQKRAENRFNSLTKLIQVTNDYDKFEGLRSTISSADSNFDSLGLDEEGDVLMALYDSKYDVMQKGQEAYDILKGMDFEINGQEAFDNKVQEVLKEDWSEVNKKLRLLYVYQGRLEAAKGMKFKGEEDFAPDMLKATVAQYQSLYANKLSLLARTGAFDIPDEEIQEFDEQFGVQLMALAPEDFNKMMTKHQTYLQRMFGDTETKVNYFWQKKQEGLATGTASADVAIAGMPIGATMTAETWGKRYDEYLEVAKNVNERHNQFYGSYFSDNPRFKKIEDDDTNGNNIHSKILQVVKAHGGDTEGDDTEEDDIEGDEDKKIDLISPPSYSIDLDVSKTVEDVIAENLKSDEIGKSIKTSNFVSKSTGNKIDIVGFNKNDNTYLDSDGNKLSIEEVAITSIDNIEPQLKLGNGKYFYFNPMTNKIEEWASNKNYKNQFQEEMVIDGKVKKVPVLKKGGYKGTLHWIDGKWKYLGRKS